MGMAGENDDRVRSAGEAHPLLALADTLSAALDQIGSGPSAGVSALADHQLEQLATAAWRLIQQLHGSLLLPVLAEADYRRLFRRERYATSSMRDLVSGWLRCTPAAAGRLLYLAKHCVSGAYPDTGAALAAGDIDVDHARAVVQAVRRLPAELVDTEQRRSCEGSMLDTARITDAEITTAAGRRLFEVVAPEAAERLADQQAERERERAEATRWFEVTGFGIAGAKEIRLRAESEVIDALLRVMSGLLEPSATDQDSPEPNQPAAVQPGAEQSGADRPSACSADGRPRPDREPDTVPGPFRRTDRQAPGTVAVTGGYEGASGCDEAATAARMPTIAPAQPPIERRRADAAVEVIDAIARPDPLDDLGPAQLRWLADRLDASSRQESQAVAPMAVASASVASASVAPTTTPPSMAPRSVASQAMPSAGPAIPIGVAGTPGPTAGTADDDMDRASVDAGQVLVDSCDLAGPAADARTRRRGSGSGPGPAARPVRSGRRPRTERPSLVVLANYDHQSGRPRAGRASSPGAPPRLASATEIERIACTATITPVWMTNNTTPVTVATPTRFFRGKQLAALIARDGGCCFPGCSRGLRYAHAHHVRPWSEGGPTSVDNGALLCSFHHRLIHNELTRAGGWRLRIANDGLPEFIPPAWIDPERRPRRHDRYRTPIPRAA